MLHTLRCATDCPMTSIDIDSALDSFYHSKYKDKINKLFPIDPENPPLEDLDLLIGDEWAIDTTGTK